MSDAILTSYPNEGLTEERVRDICRQTPAQGSTITTVVSITPGTFTWDPYPLSSLSGSQSISFSGQVYQGAGVYAELTSWNGTFRFNAVQASVAICNNITLTSSAQTVADLSAVTLNRSFVVPAATKYLSYSAYITATRISATIVDGWVNLVARIVWRIMATNVSGEVMDGLYAQPTYSITDPEFKNLDQVLGQVTIQASY